MCFLSLEKVLHFCSFVNTVMCQSRMEVSSAGPGNIQLRNDSNDNYLESKLSSPPLSLCAKLLPAAHVIPASFAVSSQPAHIKSNATC